MAYVLVCLSRLTDDSLAGRKLAGNMEVHFGGGTCAISVHLSGAEAQAADYSLVCTIDA